MLTENGDLGLVVAQGDQERSFTDRVGTRRSSLSGQGHRRHRRFCCSASWRGSSTDLMRSSFSASSPVARRLAAVPAALSRARLRPTLFSSAKSSEVAKSITRRCGASSQLIGRRSAGRARALVLCRRTPGLLCLSGVGRAVPEAEVALGQRRLLTGLPFSFWALQCLSTLVQRTFPARLVLIKMASAYACAYLCRHDLAIVTGSRAYAEPDSPGARFDEQIREATVGTMRALPGAHVPGRQQRRVRLLHLRQRSPYPVLPVIPGPAAHYASRAGQKLS